MHRCVRPLWIWLLALALPLQALAAATMMHCGAHPSPHAHASATQPAHHAHDASSHGPVHAHGHDGGATADHHHPASDGANSLLHKCSACASCCIGLALPSADVAAPGPLKATGADLPPPATPAVAFVTGGPDRPPRTIAL